MDASGLESDAIPVGGRVLNLAPIEEPFMTIPDMIEHRTQLENAVGEVAKKNGGPGPVRHSKDAALYRTLKARLHYISAKIYSLVESRDAMCAGTGAGAGSSSGADDMSDVECTYHYILPYPSDLMPIVEASPADPYLTRLVYDRYHTIGLVTRVIGKFASAKDLEQSSRKLYMQKCATVIRQGIPIRLYGMTESFDHRKVAYIFDPLMLRIIGGFRQDIGSSSSDLRRMSKTGPIHQKPTKIDESLVKPAFGSHVDYAHLGPRFTYGVRHKAETISGVVAKTAIHAKLGVLSHNEVIIEPKEPFSYTDAVIGLLYTNNTDRLSQANRAGLRQLADSIKPGLPIFEYSIPTTKLVPDDLKFVAFGGKKKQNSRRRTRRQTRRNMRTKRRPVSKRRR